MSTDAGGGTSSVGVGSVGNVVILVMLGTACADTVGDIGDIVLLTILGICFVDIVGPVDNIALLAIDTC